jgi:predicted PurR-regulated permease PerM/uncharacterized tellurite resistance protein B-like protein
MARHPKLSDSKTPIRWAFGRLSEVADLAGLTGDQRRDFNRSIAALFFAVVRADGVISDAEQRQLDEVLDLYVEPEEVANLKTGLVHREHVDIQSECQNLETLNYEGKREIIVSLVEIAYADNEFCAAEREMIDEIATTLGVDSDIVEEACEAARNQRIVRQTVVRSGAGLLVALIVIVIFILTATFLKSVLFGLILAYFCLPLQRWYQHTFFPSQLGKALLGICHAVMAPPRRFVRSVKRKFAKSKVADTAPGDDNPEVARRQHLKSVSRACHATLATMLLVVAIILLGLTGVSASYLGKTLDSATEWFSTQEGITETSHTATVPIPNASLSGDPVAGNDEAVEDVTADPEEIEKEGWQLFVRRMTRKLEKYQPQIQELPGFVWARETVENYLQDDENRRNLMALILSKSGGLFTVTTNFIANTASFLLNLMLTIFFFSFFLQKIAVFDSRGAQRKSTGQYLVESIFKSRWLPEAAPAALVEARDIVDEIITKLQIWVKGYMWIIIIEALIYIIFFRILGVPYFFVLGFFAGLTILLPFIGPIVSALLTVTVYYAVGEPSVAVVLMIVLSFVIMNGVIEQLFLYPALVGEALGLSVLETIIVVLVGGLVAGLPGVVFAVPTASVLKFLIPKLYAAWRPRPIQSDS